MPDDPLAAIQTTADTGQPGGIPPQAEPNGSAPPASLSREDLTAAIQEAVKPYQSQLSELQRENREMREKMSSPAPTPSSSSDEQDFFSRFTSNPEEAIRSLVQGEQKQLAPLLSVVLDTAHNSLLTSHRMTVDQRYGDGTWDEVFEPVLQKVFDNARKSNPTLLASRDFVDGEVYKLRGFHEDTLAERRAKSKEFAEQTRAKGFEEITKHVLANPNLTGGIRASARGDRELSDAEKEYVALRGREGVQVDPAVLRRNTELGKTGGTTYEQWLAAQPRKEKQ